MNDAAELTALRAHIKSLERQQELLLYIVTHDLRSPVMTILGFADMLRADWHDGVAHAQSHQYLEHIRSSASRQVQIIEDLQQIALLQRQPLRCQSLNLAILAHEAVDSLPSRGSLVFIQIADTLIAQCDAALMKTALRSLLMVALQLTEHSSLSRIIFGATTTNTGVTLSIRVNDVGFDSGSDHSLLGLSRRFQTQPEFGEAGFGLLVAATIIHRHGGRIWLDSPDANSIAVNFTLSL